MFREVTQTRSDKFGPDHDETAKYRALTADALRRANRHSEAIAEYEGLWPHWNRWEEKIKEVVPIDLANLAACYATVGNHAAAARVAENILRRRTNHAGSDHDDTLRSLRTLADYRRLAGQVPETVEALDRLLGPLTAKKGPTHTETLQARNILGEMYRELGRTDESIAFHRETLESTDSLPPDHGDRLVCRNNLGTALQLAGRYVEALDHFRDVYDRFRQSQGAHSYVACVAGQNLAKCLFLAGRRSEADFLFETVLADYRRNPEPTNALFGSLWSVTALFLTDNDQFVRAEAFVRESKAIREVLQPDVWTTFNTRTLLGRALLGQRKYAEAESELGPGFHGLVRHLGAIPPAYRFYVHDAGNALRTLYRETARAHLVPTITSKLPREQAPVPTVAIRK